MHPLQCIQECDTAKSSSDELQFMYAGKTVINKIGVLNSIVNTKLLGSVDMGNHISLLEWNVSRLKCMGAIIEKEIRI